MTARFNQKKYGIPFGKFSSSNHNEFPTNEVLVGREGSSRADLIEFLIQTGPQGSFLVTGRRGVGKTNFVDYCLREYERSVFKRFLRSNLGRSFSELFIWFFIPVIGVFLILCYSQLAPIVVQNIDTNPLLAILLCPIIISAIWLSVYARKIILTILKYVKIKKSKWYIAPGMQSIALILICFYILFISSIDSSPTSILSRLLILISNVYLIFQIPCLKKPIHFRSKLFIGGRVIIFNLGILCFFIFAIQLLLPPLAKNSIELFPTGFGTLGHMFLSLALILVGLASRYFEKTILWSFKAVAVGRAIIIIIGVFGFFIFAIQPLAALPKNTIEFFPTGFGTLGNVFLSIVLVLVGLACRYLGKSKHWSSKLFVGGGTVSLIMGFLGLLLFVILLLHQQKLFNLIPGGFNTLENIFLSSGLILVGLAGRFADLYTKLTLINCENRPPESILSGIKHGLIWIGFFIVFISVFMLYLYFSKYFNNLRLEDNEFITFFGMVCGGLAIFILISSLVLMGKDFDHSSGKRSKTTQNSNDKNILENYLELLAKIKPEVILFLKALSFLIIAYQLVIPLLTKMHITPDLIAFNDQNDSYLNQQSIPIKEKGLITEYKSLKAQNGILVKKYIVSVENQYKWIAMVSILLFSIYCIEYEWIVRPRIIAREDNALSPGERPWWSDFTFDDTNSKPDGRAWGRWYNLELERLSLPYLTYATWMPTLITTINLGFDSLDQKRVIQAMLVGLRQKYHAVFLSWNSVRANLKRFVYLNGIFVIVLIISNVFFDIADNASILREGSTESDSWKSVEKSISLITLDKKNQAETTKFYPKFNTELESNYCQAKIKVNDFSKYPTIPLLFCKMSNEIGNIAISILYFEIIPIEINKEGPANQIIFNLFHLNRAFPEKLSVNIINGPIRPLEYSTLSLRTYHLLVFLLTFSILRWINIKSPFFSHNRNIQQIDDLLDTLTGRVSRTKSRELSKPAQWIQSIFIDSESRTFEQEKSDPRTIELAFLSVLNNIRHTSNVLPLAFSKKTYTQAIEVTFVFDELDKLSSHLDGENKSYRLNASNNESSQNKTNEYQAAQVRRDNMQHLLSDLKRILSSASARFIFVGGRQLYDQWLADGTKKQPLLTSIFNGQVNLKSLLVHHDNHWDDDKESPKNLSDNTTFHSRIEEYLYLQYYYSEKRHFEWVRKQWVPFFGLHDELQIDADFSQWTYNLNEQQFYNEIKFVSCEEIKEGPQYLSKFYLESFVHFLTYRSAGNPKKLKELLAGFIQPTSRVIRKSELRESNFPDQDILALTSMQTLRIELISSIYEHLRSGFEQQLITRDDKIVEALFYLTDFLFKFHSRAFSWDSLERIDELDHVHRPPDLHKILEKLVEHSSEKFLHIVLNGMYSFRFRSDMTKEIEFLSRYSVEEMAAFNFTLDESQVLKQSYKRALGSSDNVNSDLVSGLGALYEYDQDFEAARHNYRHAIKILDAQLENVVGSKVLLEGNEDQKIQMLKAIYSGELSGKKNSTYDLSWGGTRLRIMLKIGLTFELTKNYERAVLQYRQCVVLSNILIDAYLIKLSNGLRITEPPIEWPLDDNVCEHNQVLKHLNIIFQPMFANAWAAEKWIGAIDSGTSIIEKELLNLRIRLPFVNKRDITWNKEATQQIVGIGNAYFSVIVSQLHNKAGDLYFFKGTQNEDYKVFGAEDETVFDNTGYLLKAHKHYAISLHEMRRYIFYRKCRAVKSRYVQDAVAKKNRPIAEGCWPNYQALGVAEGLSDLSESTLALVSGWQLTTEICCNYFDRERYSLFPKFTDEFKQDISTQIIKWFEMPDECTKDIAGSFAYYGKVLGLSTKIIKKVSPPLKTIYRVVWTLKELPFNDWFGTWVAPPLFEFKPESEDKIIDLAVINSITDRFLMSLYLSIASADLRKRAGYLENAAREYLQICDTISQYFWWVCSQNQLEGKILGNSIKDKDYLIYCLSIGVWVLEHTDELYRFSRKTEVKGKYKIGKTIPPSALTLACSLSIAARLIFPVYFSDKNQLDIKGLGNRLTKLIIKWRGEDFNETGLQIITADDVEKDKKIQGFKKQIKECTILIVISKDTPSLLTIVGFDGEGSFNKVEHDTLNSKFQTEINKTSIDKVVVAELAASELGFITSFKDRNNSTIKDFQTIIKDSICIHKYPVLNQLNSLKLLIDSCIYSDGKLDLDCTGWIEELHELNSRYNAPLHFTPNMAGITYASYWLRGKNIKGSTNNLNFDLESETLRLFRESREMHTMGRSYYASIDSLYYLYDDFNDRLIHQNHAMQMASAELIRQYEKRIIDDIK